MESLRKNVKRTGRRASVGTDSGKNWRDAATSQGTPKVARNPRREAWNRFFPPSL